VHYDVAALNSKRCQEPRPQPLCGRAVVSEDVAPGELGGDRSEPVGIIARCYEVALLDRGPGIEGD